MYFRETVIPNFVTFCSLMQHTGLMISEVSGTRESPPPPKKKKKLATLYTVFYNFSYALFMIVPLRQYCQYSGGKIYMKPLKIFELIVEALKVVDCGRESNTNLLSAVQRVTE